MKKSIQSVFLAFVFLTVLSSGCAPDSTPVPPTFTPSPIPPTFTPEPTATIVPATATVVPPTPTPLSPYTYVDFGSPYAKDCGDGIPRMGVDWAFNGIDYGNRYGGINGHVDIVPPKGCDVYSFEGDQIAPVPGTFSGYKNDTEGLLKLTMPKYTLINGMDKVLAHVGVTDFNPEKVDQIWISYGHLKLLRDLPKGAAVEQGQPIGDVQKSTGGPLTNTKVSLHVLIRYYPGTTYVFSPSMFFKETGRPTWPCYDEKYIISLYPADWPLDLVEPCNPKYNFYP
jgi:hypothetical protein